MTTKVCGTFRRVLLGFSLSLCCAVPLRAADDAAVGPPAAAAVPATAQIVTDPASPLELGDVFEDEVREIRLKVLNRSDAPVKVVRVRSSCPCTVPKAPSPEPIPPGGSAEIEAQFLGARVHDGPFHRALTIDLEGATRSFVVVQLRGTRVPNVAVKPDRDVQLPAGLNPNRVWEQTFQLSSNLKDQRLRLGEPVTSPRLKAELTESSPSHFALKVTSVPALFRGRVSEEITIPLLEPAGHAPLVVRVHGQMGFTLRIVPALLQLRRPATAGAPVTAKVSVYGAPLRSAAGELDRNRRQAVDLDELQVRAPAGVTATPANVSGRAVITFSFPPALLETMTQGMIEIETASGGVGKLGFVVNATIGDGDAVAEPVKAPLEKAPAATVEPGPAAPKP